jgi:hypothetical protein
MSPDLAARRVLMSCYLYYVLDVQVWDDAAYDAAVKMIVEWWGEIESIRRWQMRAPEDIAATGHHVRLTRLTCGAAIAWYRLETGLDAPLDRSRPRWTFDPAIGCEWRSC